MTKKQKKEMKENAIVDKRKKFALRIIRMYRYLCNKKSEFVMSTQALKSGTGNSTFHISLKNSKSKFKIYPNGKHEFFQMGYSVWRMNMI